MPISENIKHHHLYQRHMYATIMGMKKHPSEFSDIFPNKLWNCISYLYKTATNPGYFMQLVSHWIIKHYIKN